MDAGLIVALLAMLLLGKILGDAVHRLGFAPLIGQMIAGIVLGPMVLNIVRQTSDMQMLTDIAILFMMFLMGLSVDLEKVMGENVYKATLVTLCGGSLAFASTSVITALLGFPLNQALLVGVSFISTSTAIGFMVLTGFGDRHSKVFKTIMAVGVTDDIYAILGLSLYTSFVFATVDIKLAFALFLGVLGFIIFVLSFGRRITEELIAFSRSTADDQPIIAFSLILMFFVAYLGLTVNIASVSGAFLAGTILARSPLSYKVISPRIESVSEGLFIPIFFVYTGVRINAFDVLHSQGIDLVLLSVPIGVVLFLGVLMAVMASKYVGTFAATTFIGDYTTKEVHKMALTMMPMGEYTLVIGQIGLTTLFHGAPVIDTKIYSVLALVVLTISVLAPIMLRKAYEG